MIFTECSPSLLPLSVCVCCTPFGDVVFAEPRTVRMEFFSSVRFYDTLDTPLGIDPYPRDRLSYLILEGGQR